MNNGDGTFRAATGASFTQQTTDTTSVALGDLDGNGMLDVIVLGVDVNELHINQGNGAVPSPRNWRLEHVPGSAAHRTGT